MDQGQRRRSGGRHSALKIALLQPALSQATSVGGYLGVDMGRDCTGYWTCICTDRLWRLLPREHEAVEEKPNARVVVEAQHCRNVCLTQATRVSSGARARRRQDWGTHTGLGGQSRWRPFGGLYPASHTHVRGPCCSFRRQSRSCADLTQVSKGCAG